MNVLHTAYTNHVLLQQEGLEAAEHVFDRFQHIPHAEQLARLSLRIISGKTDIELSTNDHRNLVHAQYLKNLHDDYPKALTIPGIVAVNMVWAELIDDDLAFELREPFQGMQILSAIHASHKTRKLETP